MFIDLFRAYSYGKLSHGGDHTGAIGAFCQPMALLVCWVLKTVDEEHMNSWELVSHESGGAPKQIDKFLRVHIFKIFMA